MASTVDCPGPVTTKLPQSPDKKPGQLTDQQLDQYYENGFLVVTDFFRPEELEPCKEAISEMVDELAEMLHKAGKIKDRYKDAGIFQRLTLLDKEFPGAFVLMFKQGKLHKAFRDLWSNERLLNIMEQLVGPEVSCHPVWNLRPKVPKNDATAVPWHQDSGYFDQESYDHIIPTTWIPFLDTNANNGGMQMVKRAHRHGRVVRHTCCWENTWYIDLAEEEMVKSLGVDIERDVETVEVPYGGFLLFQNITPHRSLPNSSNDVRWSIDLRWQSPHEKWGFYDIQEGALMRHPDKPDLKVDWDKFIAVNRKKVWQDKYCKKTDETADEFDTTVTGPWLGRWDIVHRNKHTEAFVRAMAV
ncbi:uncharacterized protein LOC135493597 [Lineus longissimus]|uniref:uncharacterized protein LOC135493597 n=1 Tax=Lineus longissimus TaxID=88925 RepID=UPI002B4CA63F